MEDSTSFFNVNEWRYQSKPKSPFVGEVGGMARLMPQSQVRVTEAG
jgi:hypothetical protein